MKNVRFEVVGNATIASSFLKIKYVLELIISGKGLLGAKPASVPLE